MRYCLTETCSLKHAASGTKSFVLGRYAMSEEDIPVAVDGVVGKGVGLKRSRVALRCSTMWAFFGRTQGFFFVCLFFFSSSFVVLILRGRGSVVRPVHLRRGPLACR